jgi:uncharacterized protein
MSTYVLNNELIFKSFLIGAKNVINEKKYLNQINVFPVADGDTGSNLANMMNSIIAHAKMGNTSEETLKSIAEAAIIGARGNSGIIFAQYIIGFSEAIANDVISEDAFILGAETGFNYAYQSIAEPVEGTMITVMRTWSHALKQFKNATQNTLDLFSKAYESIKDELQKTKEKLAVLKQNKVVDAGAKGFVTFIEGFILALKGEHVDLNIEDGLQVDELHAHHDEVKPSDNRYCTEALMKGVGLDINLIRNELSKFGDSIVVAGSKNTVRVHLHSNTPDLVFAYLSGISQILEQKVDDMLRQYQAVNERKYKIALVTDSIADLPKSMIDQYQIHQFPINLTIDDANYLDKLTISSSRFYQMMDTLETYPKSSQPNPVVLKSFFSFLTTHYQEIIVVTVSSKMSGTYQSFIQAAKEFPNHNIKVIDSKQNSGAEGLLVQRTAELIDEGLEIDQIVKIIEDTIKKSKILVSVRTLKYMIRSGRLSKTKGLVAKIMNLKPVVSIDEEGNGIILEKAFSLKSSNEKIKKHMTEIHQKYGILTYAIVHANAEDRAKSYEEIYEKIIGKKPAYVMDISTVVAMNAGIGTVAIAYIRGEKS